MTVAPACDPGKDGPVPPWDRRSELRRAIADVELCEVRLREVRESTSRHVAMAAGSALAAIVDPILLGGSWWVPVLYVPIMSTALLFFLRKHRRDRWNIVSAIEIHGHRIQELEAEEIVASVLES